MSKKIEKKQTKESEFGQGLTYNIALFLMHVPKYFIEKRKHQDMEMEFTPYRWMNAASDHFYDLKIPSNFSEELKKRIWDLQEYCLDVGHEYGINAKKFNDDDFNRVVREAKDILMEIDIILGVTPIKASWE